MTIKVGDTIPSMKLMMATADGPKEVSTDDVFKGKKVVLFAVPGAFTPTCSSSHLPGFLAKIDAFKARGVDEIALTSVNDAFVLDAWAKSSGAEGKISFLADGSGEFAKALGLSLDLTERGLGVRSQRYAMLVEDGVVRNLNVEPVPSNAEVSSADALLAQIYKSAVVRRFSCAPAPSRAVILGTPPYPDGRVRPRARSWDRQRDP